MTSHQRYGTRRTRYGQYNVLLTGRDQGSPRITKEATSQSTSQKFNEATKPQRQKYTEAHSLISVPSITHYVYIQNLLLQ
jgi:hypothetical protein